MTVCNEDEDAYFDKVLQSALHRGRREKRIEMVYILGELRDTRALNALKTIMTEDDPYLVSEASRGCRKDQRIKGHGAASDHDASSSFYGERRGRPGHG